MIVLTTLAALSIRLEKDRAAPAGGAGDPRRRPLGAQRAHREADRPGLPGARGRGDRRRHRLARQRGRRLPGRRRRCRCAWSSRAGAWSRCAPSTWRRSARIGTVAAVRIGENRYFPDAADPAVPSCGSRKTRLPDRAAARLPAAGLEFAARSRTSTASCWRISAASARPWPTSSGAAPAVDAIFPFPYAQERRDRPGRFRRPTPGRRSEIRAWPKTIADLDGADLEELRRKAAAGLPPAGLRRRRAPAGEPAQAVLPAAGMPFFQHPLLVREPAPAPRLPDRPRPSSTGEEPRSGPRPRARSNGCATWPRATGSCTAATASAASPASSACTSRARSAEFLKIEYQDREFLYVPLHELDVLKRYSGSEGGAPALDRLGGKTWRPRPSAPKRRSSTTPATCSTSTPCASRCARRRCRRCPSWRTSCSRISRFVETEDQKQAIRPVLADMEADFPMDRLICGDVSFGKTEVALRAALRAVANGKQVAFLCPTTILALQHFRNFERRLAAFPLRLAMLSRLVCGGGKKARRRRARRAAASTWWSAPTRCWPRGWSSRTWGCSSSTRSSASASSRRRS